MSSSSGRVERVDDRHVGERHDRAEQGRDGDQRHHQRDRDLKHPPPVAATINLGLLLMSLGIATSPAIMMTAANGDEPPRVDRDD